MKKKKILKIKLAITAICVLILCFTFIDGNASGKTIENFSTVSNIYIYSPNTEITAHRGYSINAKENTLNAFKKAKEAGAKWIELDVRKTKDNVIVVSHDDNLKRVFKKNLIIKNTKYSVLKKYNIPTLKESLKLAKDYDLHVNIELKEAGYEKEIIKIVNELDLKSNVVITSFNYDALKNVEKLDSSFTTLFTVGSTKNVDKYNKVDGYSVLFTGTSKEKIEELHNQGKIVYLWTVDRKISLQKAFTMGADNIITNRVEDAFDVLNDMTYVYTTH
jgi:glycerophosphoryl diester phosphodiesterase